MPQVAIPLAISFALSAAMYAVQRFTQKPLKPGDRNFKINITDTKTFVPTVYGRAKVGISRIYALSRGKDLKDLWVVGEVCHGPIHSFEKIWFDDALVWEGDTGVVEEYQKNVKIWVYTGTDNQTVNTELRDISNGEWTNDHRGRGIAYIVVNIRYSLGLFPNGLPQIYVLVRGKKVYDPRDGSTAISANPSLCVLDYLTARDADGNIRYGLGAVRSDDDTNEVDENSFIAMANYYDEEIVLGMIDPPEACKVKLISDQKYQELVISGGAVTLAETPVSGSVSVQYTTVGGDEWLYTQTIYEGQDFTVSGNVVSFTYLTDGSTVNVTYNYIPGGNLGANGRYRYLVTFKTASGETTAGAKSVSIQTTGNRKKGKLYDIPIAESNDVIARNIYRTKKDGSTFYLLTTINDNTTEKYTDNIADASLPATQPPGTNTADGVQKRYRCNGVVDNSQGVKPNLEDLLSSCRGHLTGESGLFEIYTKRATVPETFELNDDTILGDWRWEVKGISATANIVKASFANATKKWETDYVTWPIKRSKNVYLADDNDFENPKEIDLPYTDNKKMAKRITQITRKESRERIICSCVVKEAALRLKLGNLVNVKAATPGWNKKPFWVDRIGLQNDGNIRVFLEEYDATVYDEETLDVDTEGAPDTELPDPLEAPDEVTNVLITEESFVNRNTRQWRLKVNFANPSSAFWDYSEVYVKYGSTDYELYTTISKECDGVFYIHPIQEFANYYIKIISVSMLGVKQGLDSADVTVWSHTTGNVTNPPDVSNIGAMVKGDTVTLSWAYLSDITDFDYYEIREGSGWDTSILVAKTKSTTLVLVGVTEGTHTYRIKAVDTAGNYSVNDVYTNPPAFVESSALWTDRITTDFTDGTHIGTEAATVGGLKSVRAKQYITNYSFETDTSGWNLGTGWTRTSTKSYTGSYSLISQAGTTISNTNKNDSEIEAEAGRTYVFTSYVWCDKPNCARIVMRADNGGEVASDYHPGDSTWRLLSVTQTVITPYGTPYVGLRRSLGTGTAAFDYCGYAMLRAEYISPSYDRSTSKLQKCLLEFTSYISNPSSPVVVDAGISNDGSSYTWYPGLEVSEVLTAGRYSKFRINFINVLPFQYNRIMEDAGGLVHYQEAIPSDPVDIQVPQLGAEKVINGSFTGSATGWTLGSGWAYGTNNVTKNADGVGALSQNVSAVVGEIYEIVYTVSAWTAGDFVVSLGGSSVGRIRRQTSFMPNDVSTGYGNGTHKDVVVARTTGDLIFQPTNNARFTIDNVSVKKVGIKNSQTTKVWTSDFGTSDARLNIMSELTDDVMSLGGGRIASRKSVNGWTGDQILIDTEGYCSQDGSANSGADGGITHKYEAIKVTASGTETMRTGAFGIRLKATGTLTYNTGTISVANGSYIITGSGTNWPTDDSWDGQQMIFKSGDSVGYVIYKVISATEIQLYEFYRGDDSSGNSYEVRTVASSLTEGLNLYLYTDNAGVPGSIISDEIVLVPFGLLGTSYVEYLGLITNTHQLQNGTSYWIVIERYLAPGNGVVCYHEMKAQGTNAHAYSADGSSWTTENNKQGWYRFYAYYGTNIKSVSQYSTAVTGYGWAHPGGYFYSELSAALQGESRGKDAVQGLSVYGKGVYGKSIYGKAIEGYTEKGTTAKFRRKIDYSSVSSIMQIVRGGGGGSSTGYGGRISFELQDSGGTDYSAAGITAIFTKTGSGVSSGQLVFELMKDGSEEREKVWFDDFAHIFGGRKIATYNSVSVTNANKNVLSKTGIHTSVSVGDMALVCQGTNIITTPPPVHRVVTVGTDSITLDRDCRTAGSDATDFSVQIFKDVIALCATDNTNGNMITCFSHQNKPLQLGGNTLASTSGLGFSGEDVTLAGILNVDVSAQKAGVGSTIGDATLSIKTFNQNAVVNIYGVDASTDYGVIQVSDSGGLSNPSSRPLVLQPNAGYVGVRKIDPNGIVEINLGSTPDPVRLSYNTSSGSASNYTDLKTNSSGNFSIKPSGSKVVINLNNPDLTNNGLHISGQILRIDASKTPSSSSDAGKAGEWCWDTQYFYVCVATNSWARVPILTW